MGSGLIHLLKFEFGLAGASWRGAWGMGGLKFFEGTEVVCLDLWGAQL